MASLETRIVDLETQFTEMENEIFTSLRTKDLAILESDRDEQSLRFMQELAQIGTELVMLQQAVNVAKIEIALRRRPRTFTIAAGSLVYVVSHALGYKPQVQVVSSANIIVGSASVTITHLSNAKFQLTFMVPTFAGTALYR